MISGIITLVTNLAVIVFVYMGIWRLYQKGGQPGWKCLIPFYSDYVLATIATRDKRIAVANAASTAACVFLVFGGIVLSGLNLLGTFMSYTRGYSSGYGLGGGSLNIVTDIVFALATLAVLCKGVMTIVVSLKLAYAFDESFATAVLLMVAAPLTLPLMGFVSSIEYYGPDGEA